MTLKIKDIVVLLVGFISMKIELNVGFPWNTQREQHTLFFCKLIFFLLSFLSDAANER